MIFNRNGQGDNEVRQHATWTAMHSYTHISQALYLAKRKLLKIIDAITYKLAYDHYWSIYYQYVTPDVPEEGAPTPEEIAAFKLLDELVHKMQVVLVYFAYEKNINKSSVVWDNSGIKVVWNNDMRPAQKETLEELEESLEKHGYEFLDLLIEFLNQNATTFTAFQQSVENLRLKELFINDAVDFSYYHNIENSTSCFFELLDCIRRVQRTDLYGALTYLWYSRVTDYQRKRQNIEANSITLQTYEQLLNITPVLEQIALVTEEKKYYIFNEEWTIYCYDVRELLVYIKPALVYLSVHAKLFSEIPEGKKDQKQIEIFQANANYFKQLGDAELAKIVKHIESITKPFVDPYTLADTFVQQIITKNSFSI